MLLNYLFSNFQEERAFAQTCGVSLAELSRLIEARVFPSPSYVYESNGRSLSFVSDFSEDTKYRFHLSGHATWFDGIGRFGLDDESRARDYFFKRYEAAKETFLTSDFGLQLAEVAPDIATQFDIAHANSTWKHFLNGVYGVCTRDGQPESVFLKQVCVMFIEKMIAGGPGSLSAAHLQLLKRTVAFLDTVESEFAPHEIPQTSRQRCIIDVNSRFFEKMAA